MREVEDSNELEARPPNCHFNALFFHSIITFNCTHVYHECSRIKDLYLMRFNVEGHGITCTNKDQKRGSAASCLKRC